MSCSGPFYRPDKLRKCPCGGRLVLFSVSQQVIEVNSADLRKTGISSSGIGFASNSLRQGTASQRAIRVAFCLRALSRADGADGYVVKDAPTSQLLDAITHIQAGRVYVSPFLWMGRS